MRRSSGSSAITNTLSKNASEGADSVADIKSEGAEDEFVEALKLKDLKARRLRRLLRESVVPEAPSERQSTGEVAMSGKI